VERKRHKIRNFTTILSYSTNFDSSVATTAERQTREIDNAGVQIAKAKRRVTRPAYLRDYA